MASNVPQSIPTFTIDALLQVAKIPENKFQSIKAFLEWANLDETTIHTLTEESLEKLAVKYTKVDAKFTLGLYEHTILQSAKLWVKDEAAQSKPWNIIEAKCADLISQSPLKVLLENPETEIQLPLFIPSKNHPFYNSIVKARVPISKIQQPDLLLHNLPLNASEEEIMQAESGIFLETNENVVDADDDTMEIEETLRKPTKHLLKLTGEFSKSATAGNCAVLFGVSGCSKTRTLYEVLSRRFGLYFTGSVGGNSGSSDLATLMTMLEEQLCRVSATDREAYGTHYVNALLYARLLVLERILGTKNPNPYYWLLMQLKSSFLAGQSTDLFDRLLNILLRSNPSDLAAILRNLIYSLRDKLPGNLLVVVDEAQILIDKCQHFHGPTQTSVHGLLAKLITTYTQFPQVSLVVAGTDLRLRQSLQIVASAVAKQAAEIQRYLVVDFGGYHERDAMKQYLKQFFPLDDDQMTAIFKLLQGRYRYAAFFAEKVMAYQDPYTDASVLISNVLDSMLTWSAENSVTSPSRALWSLHQLQTQNMLEGQSPFQIYRDLTVAYYLFDKKLFFHNDKVLSMVERGICPLHRSSTGALTACISEPLTAWAIRSFFATVMNDPIENTILEYIGKCSVDSQTHGIFFEYYLVPAVIRYFSKASTIDRHPYFEHYFDTYKGKREPPKWWTGATLKVSNKDAPVIKKATPSFNFTDYLSNPNICDVFIPENEARHDAVMRICAADGTEHLVVMQWKLRKNMGDKEVQEAVYTTDPMSAYTTKSHTINPRKRKQKSQLQTLQQFKFPREDGAFRVLFSYPHIITEEQFDKLRLYYDNDILAIMDRQRSGEMFSKARVWRFLDELLLYDQNNPNNNQIQQL